MKCRACDHVLTDFESSRRSATTSAFLDLCTPCLSIVVESIPTQENWNLFDGTDDDIVCLPNDGGKPSEKGYGPDSDDLIDDEPLG